MWTSFRALLFMIPMTSTDAVVLSGSLFMKAARSFTPVVLVTPAAFVWTAQPLMEIEFSAL